MKKTMLLVLAVLAGNCFAGSLSFSKDSPALNEMAQAFKSTPVDNLPHQGQATAMTYTGNDISRRPTLVLHTAAA